MLITRSIVTLVHFFAGKLSRSMFTSSYRALRTRRTLARRGSMHNTDEHKQTPLVITADNCRTDIVELILLRNQVTSRTRDNGGRDAREVVRCRHMIIHIVSSLQHYTSIQAHAVLPRYQVY